MTDDIPRLRITIENQNEIELFEFANSMASLNDEYNRYLSQKGTKKKPECRLYIHKISEGSTVIELIERAPELLPGVAPTLVEFSRLIVLTYDYLNGKEKKLPDHYKFRVPDFANFSKLVELAANFKGNTIGFLGLNFGGQVVNHIYNSTEAAAIQNQSEREIKKLKASGDSLIKENILLRLYQARDSQLSVSAQGNLGIIEEISSQPKVLSFANDRLRYDITRAEQNPFNFTYSVDIEVRLREGSLSLDNHSDIKGYEILKLHGPIQNQDLLD